MKILIDNYKNFIISNENEIYNFQDILLSILQSDILIENIERTNKSNNTKGIKSTEVKNIIKLILFNYISNHISNTTVKKLEITQSTKHNIYIIEYNDKTFCLKFQTANWAVLYKDFFQFTNDEYYQSFDNIIYLVPDKILCAYLSAGTVNYENTLKFMRKYSIGLKNNFSIFGLNISS
jgi:hypothetical protein